MAVAIAHGCGGTWTLVSPQPSSGRRFPGSPPPALAAGTSGSDTPRAQLCWQPGTTTPN
eukprot:CAMPEP_0204322370 /NCGR_PEP_ID=MMETSP0469-20131031/8652_1 /ASSEMBLY_ACC=CAM_ASM_000384 /TAXON_ID=2969 /ORGANISM="Oxyrrhis marina" /LENGTH=58 /DNA_ID=CAMNT_0051303709 /DNA_START=85 /DNA_END=261 /DNA_ORIENTATION=-